MSTEVPIDIFLARGMLSHGEVRALYTAARDFYQGEGAIIDAGAFAGLSAHCFASGVRDNSSINNRTCKIYSYDKFIASEKYIREYIEANFYSHRAKDGSLIRLEHKMTADERFINIFKYQNDRFSDMITICDGNFLDYEWSGDPIEILFADICKTKNLQDHLYTSFMRHMIPGGSILIHQDYNHPPHPYIQLSMEKLRPYFETLVFSEGDTKIFYLKEELPDSAIRAAIDLKFEPEEVRVAYDRIVEEAADDRKSNLRVAEVNALRFMGYEAEANQRALEVAVTLLPGERFRWRNILGTESGSD
jgi:hypothetical protein